MTTPCEWAQCAINKKGDSFELSFEGKTAKANLVSAEHADIGGGYEAYTFGFESPDTPESPQTDGTYVVSGGGCGEAEVFVVHNNHEEMEHYVISITCKTGS